MTNPEIQTFLDKHGYDKIDLKAVLIDMDGVLYDSMKNHANAWYETISALGIDSTPREFYLYEGRTGASTEVMPLKIYIPSYGDSYLQIFPTQIKFFIQK